MFAAALDLFVGGACLGCDRPGWWLCGECRRSLVPAPVPTYRPGFAAPIWAAGSYTGVLRRVLPAYKDEHAIQLSRRLAPLLAAAVVAAPRASFLVPLPSSAAAVRQRGYQHVERVTRAASSWLTPRPTVLTALRHSGAKTADQAHLRVDERARNVRGVLQGVPGRGRVLICDDIVTTGATLAEAARALALAGYTVVGAAVIAHTPRLHADKDT